MKILFKIEPNFEAKLSKEIRKHQFQTNYLIKFALLILIIETV